MTAVLNFSFSFFASPLLPLFLPRVLFLLLGSHLVGFILVRNVFGKACRILGLGERRGRWAMEQDFHGKFRVRVPVPGSQIVGKTWKWKEREKLGGGKKEKRRVFTLSQFNYLGAWKSGYFLSGLLDRNMLIVVWCERSLHPSKVRWQSCPGPSKTDDVTSGRRDVVTSFPGFSLNLRQKRECWKRVGDVDLHGWLPVVQQWMG